MLVWRPVHYLGNKQRSLPAIRGAVDELTGGRPADVADAFCGSAVVTQALALGGHRVRAVDASPAAAVLARATTGAGRAAGAPSLHDALGPLFGAALAEYAERAAPWAAHLAEERAALDAGDAVRLAAVEARFPQVWRDPGAACPGTAAVFAAWHAAAAARTPCPPGFLSAVYAGTYLSLRQCLVLEAFLAVVQAAEGADTIDAWTSDAARALAMHAASAASFSAGKHFAQPHLLAPGKDLTFHLRRLRDDRAVDAHSRMRDGAGRLEAVAAAIARPASVLCAPVASAAPAWAGAAVVYADPPYTTQQYSRFYHVLDLIASGVPRPLQPARGGGAGATRGLYPTGRFLSDFCRASRAPEALRGFVRDVRSAGAHLVLSYSVSATGATGNARVIPLATVTGIVAEGYGPANVDCRTLPLEYRSFNRTSVPNSADREVLVVARAA